MTARSVKIVIASRDDLSVDNRTALSVELREAAEAVATSAAALAALAGVGVDVEDQPGADRLRDVADACLDGFAEIGRLEARAAAVKVRLAAEYAAAAAALVAPAASPQECTAGRWRW